MITVIAERNTGMPASGKFDTAMAVIGAANVKGCGLGQLVRGAQPMSPAPSPPRRPEDGGLPGVWRPMGIDQEGGESGGVRG